MVAGACMVAGGHAWLQGACMVAGGHAWLQGGHAWWQGHVWWQGDVHGIQPDTVNEWAVRILLECILVGCLFFHAKLFYHFNWVSPIFEFKIRLIRLGLSFQNQKILSSKLTSCWFSIRSNNQNTTEPTVSVRHRKALSNLQSCMADSSCIHLILLIKLIQ